MELNKTDEFYVDGGVLEDVKEIILSKMAEGFLIVEDTENWIIRQYNEAVDTSKVFKIRHKRYTQQISMAFLGDAVIEKIKKEHQQPLTVCMLVLPEIRTIGLKLNCAKSGKEQEDLEYFINKVLGTVKRQWGL